jgi:hypothetical protein
MNPHDIPPLPPGTRIGGDVVEGVLGRGYLVEHPLTSASIPGRFIDEKGNGKTASRESGRRRQHRGVAATSAVERLRPQTR